MEFIKEWDEFDDELEDDELAGYGDPDPGFSSWQDYYNYKYG